MHKKQIYIMLEGKWYGKKKKNKVKGKGHMGSFLSVLSFKIE